MKKQILLLAFLLLCVGTYCEASDPVVAMSLQLSVPYKEYTIKIYHGGSKEDGTEQGSLEILKNGRKVYSRENGEGRFEIGVMNEENPRNKLKEVGLDITGGGEPNLVVTHFEAPGHARFQYYVFSLGKEFKLIDELQSGDLNYDASFKDVDGDGKFEFLTEDQHFGYWHSSFAGAPMPVIILKYKNGHYRLAMDLMRKPLPTAKEEKRTVQKIKKEILDYGSGKKVSSFAGDPSMGVWKDVILSPLVWGQMLDLIYSGHAEAAWKFLQEVWPKGKSGKKQFLAEFKKELAKDPYWKLLKKGQAVKGSL